MFILGTVPHNVQPCVAQVGETGIIMSDNRKYKFSWDVIGADMALARPNLGPMLRIELYRLFQFTIRDILEQRYGTNATDEIFREAGDLAGREFFKQFCSDAKDLNTLVKILTDAFKELGLGIFRVEAADTDKLEFTLTVEEDLDCSGLPDIEGVICIYDEGFIKGILDSFTGRDFQVAEVDCWCTGARTCRFEAKLSS